MLIIDNSKAPAPILVRKPTPTTFKSAYEEQKYFAKKLETWIEGVGEVIDGQREIPGSFVFATDECVVKHRQGGKMGRYEPTDCGLLIHQTVRRAKNNGRASFFLKGRGIGLSTEGMGVFPFYTWKTQPGSSSLITSKGQKEIFALYNDKFKPPIDPESSIKMDPRIFSTKDYAIKNEHTKSIHIAIRVHHLDEEGSPTISKSELYCMETTHDDKAAKGFSGKGAAYAFLDEYPLHPRKELLWGSVEECFKDPRIGSGMLAMVIMGGTCEFGMTSDQLLKLFEFWENAEAKDIERCFVSACYTKYMTNGHSDFKKYMEFHEKECERKAKDPDPNVLLTFEMNNPIYEKDIWKFAQGKFFTKQATDILALTAKELVTQPPIIIRCDLVNKHGQKIVEDKKPNGLWEIFERSRQGADYYMLIDGVASDKTAGDKTGSAVGAIVMKGYDSSVGIDGSYYPVAVSLDRPDSIPDSYINLKNAFLYYNEFGGFRKFFAEGNAGNASHFGAYLRAEGLWQYVPWAKDLSGKGNTNTDKPFQYVTGDILDFAIREASPFIVLHGHKIKFITLLNDLLKAKDANADLRSAFLAYFYYMKKNFYLPLAKPKEEVKQQRRVIMDIGGKNQAVWV